MFSAMSLGKKLQNNSRLPPSSKLSTFQDAGPFWQGSSGLMAAHLLCCILRWTNPARSAQILGSWGCPLLVFPCLQCQEASVVTLFLPAICRCGRGLHT